MNTKSRSSRTRESGSHGHVQNDRNPRYASRRDEPIENDYDNDRFYEDDYSPESSFADRSERYYDDDFDDHFDEEFDDEDDRYEMPYRENRRPTAWDRDDSRQIAARGSRNYPDDSRYSEFNPTYRSSTGRYTHSGRTSPLRNREYRLSESQRTPSTRSFDRSGYGAYRRTPERQSGNGTSRQSRYPSGNGRRFTPHYPERASDTMAGRRFSNRLSQTTFGREYNESPGYERRNRENFGYGRRYR